MKDLWKTVRLGMYVFALPLVAITAASAHQMIADNKPIDVLVPAVTATVDGSTIGTLRSHTLAVDEDGAVRGRIVNIDRESKKAAGIGSLKIYFAQNGQVVHEVFTDADGTFVAENLQPGVYSFIAAGESGFAAYGVNIVDTQGDFPNQMEAAAVSPRFAAVREILETRVPAEVAQEIIDAAPAALGEANRLAGVNRVKLVDGDLVGSVIPVIGARNMAAGTFVHIVQNDEQIAAVEVDANGSFRIQDLDPGVYDFVATGPSGFAAVGFEAVQDEVLGATDSEVIPTAIPDAMGSVLDVDASFVDASADMAAQDFISADVPMDGGFYDPGMSFDVPMTAPMDGYIVDDSFGYAYDTYEGAPYSDGYISQPIEYAGESVGYGGACGGSCGRASNFSNFGSCGSGGGGGGRLFGGGGNLRRIAGIALLAWAITEIANDNDNGGGGGPMSPINP